MRFSVALAAVLAVAGCGRTQPTSLGDPKLSVSPTRLDLGAVLPGGALRSRVTLTNVGRVPVTQIRVQLTGGGDGPGLWSLLGELPTTLGVGQSADVTVGYEAALPPGGGSRTMRVTSDAAPAAVQLLATTLDPCSLQNCGATMNPCEGPGRCVGGLCVHDPLTGKACDDGDPCTLTDVCSAQATCAGAAVKCEAPPPTRCLDQDTLATYAPGVCQQGMCLYAPTQMKCPFGCANDKCFDPCEGVTCDQPPTQCHQDKGTCVPQKPKGVCSYQLVEQKPCNDGDACTVDDRCAMGVCQGAPMQCTTPPAGRCLDMDNAEVYDTKGFCQAGSCQYTKQTQFCGIGCMRGACQASCEVSLAAGNGQVGSNDGPATGARFSDPYSLVVDSSGTVFINDTANGAVRQLSGGQVSTVPGATGLVGPHDVALDGAGGLLVGASGRVYRIVNGMQTTLAGTGVQGMAVDGPSQTAVFGSEVSVAGSSSGAVYVTDASNERIRKIANGVVTTFAGTGAVGFQDGPNASATFQHPHDLVILPNGDLIVAETLNHAVRRVTATSTSKVAGTGQIGLNNGAPLSSRFNIPLDVAVDAEGAFYVADTGNHCVRRVALATLSPTRVSTFAGTCGTPGYQEGSATAGARFREPAGIAVGPDGTVYVSDTQNQRIRRITCRPLTPP